MNKKKASPRRENRTVVYFPKEVIEALERERAKNPLPDSMSTFLVKALMEWLKIRDSETGEPGHQAPQKTLAERLGFTSGIYIPRKGREGARTGPTSPQPKRQD